MKKAIVIGSGIGGIASALRLRHKSYEVDVFEANSYPGGKIHELLSDGFRFDMGPSLFTMPHLVDELFELFGVEPGDYFNYTAKETICNYFWEDGTLFSMAADVDQFIEEATDTFGESPQRLQQYLQKNQLKYELTTPVFLENSLHKASNYLSLNTLKAFANSHTLDLFGTLNSTNRNYFKNPRLIQLFNRFATYNGSSPYRTPGIMSMIPHLEMGIGTFFPKGGMHSIVRSLYQLAKDQGVQFHFNQPVKRILTENGSATGIVSENGSHHAHIVVSNADVYFTYKKLLPDHTPPKRTIEQERSSSALIFYWGINRKYPELDLHNILFSGDYEKEFKALFQDHTLSDDPTVYINITSKEEPADAPTGGENWFVMVNAPANHNQNWEELKAQTRVNVINKVNRLLNTNIEKHIQFEEVLDPVLIEQKTGSFRGSLYGTSSNSRFAAFLRHPNFSSKIENLYFCGGSTHPGGGIPLCLLSAKIMTNLIK